MLIVPGLLLGIAVAMLRRPRPVPLDGPRPDGSARVLVWAAGLLAAGRDEWGQAMLGELSHIVGRRQRWRFTIGCVGAALLLTPWGRAGAGAFALVVAAVGGLALSASVIVSYGLGTGSWVLVAIVLAFLIGFVFAGIVLLRRPGVAAPGLLGGLFVALLWLSVSGFGFSDLLTGGWPAWAVPVLLLLVPAVVGVVGTLWGGSALVGRRTARLAAVSAGLGVYVYATLALAVVGPGSGPLDPGWTATSLTSDRLANNFVFYLGLLPLVTATLGWSAAAATARIQPRPATNAESVPFTAAGYAEAPEALDAVVRLGSQSRTARVTLIVATAATAALLASGAVLKA